MSELLQHKIDAARAKHTLVAVGTGTVLAAAFFLAAVMLGGFLDWFFDFPWLFRVLLLLAYVAGAGYLLTRHAILPLLYGPDDETIALAVEHAEPSFATRLIAAVQFTEAESVPRGISKSLIREMIRQTEALADEMDFTAVFKMDRLGKWSLAAAGAVLLFGALWAYGGDTSRILLSRVFLAHTAVPTKTQVQCESRSYTIPRGEDAPLSGRVTGWHPSLGRAEITYESGRRQSVTLERLPESASLYAAKLESVQESFTYYLRVYDGRTESFQVTVKSRPAVAALRCEQIYPRYTGLGTVPRSPGDLSLLVGSKLRLAITANKAVRLGPNAKGQMNRVLLATTVKDQAPVAVPLVTNPTKRDELSADIDLPATTMGFSIELIDDDDLPSKDSPVYRIDMLPDRPPTIRLTAPDRKEVLVTRNSELRVGFLAEDDYMLGKLTLKYRIEDGPEQAIALALEPRQKLVRGYYPWMISKVPLPADRPNLEGSAIEYWLEIEDTNDVSGPGKGASDHYQARVVSKADKQKELIDRLTEQFSAVKEVAEHQDETSRDLGALILEQPTGPRPR